MDLFIEILINYIYRLHNCQMKRVWVLAWIILSTYHLVDFLLYFTPIYGEPLPFNAVPLYLWADVGEFVVIKFTSLGLVRILQDQV